MLIPNPTFTTKAGCEFHISPVSILNMNTWARKWKERHPEPKPPLRKVTIVDTEIAEPDYNNPYYQKLVAEWNEKFSEAQLNYVISRGVLDTPPDGWMPDPELVDNPNDLNERKALWITSQILTTEDIAGIQEAILSLMSATEKAVEESSKK